MEVKKGNAYGERLQAERKQNWQVYTKQYRIRNKFGMERDNIYTKMTTMWTRMWIQGLDASWLSMEKVQNHAQRNDMQKKKILVKCLKMESIVRQKYAGYFEKKRQRMDS